tara:strand:+ start:1245 stop:1916 length:672 start_codon:yes stop_codon:yes gene_type:complete
MDIQKIFDVTALFSPFLLVSFMVLLSIYNQDLKAIVLVFGLIVLTLIVKGTNFVNENNDDEDNYTAMCTLFNVIEVPGISTAIISFIAMFLILPMIFNKQYNYFLITVMSILLTIDITFRTVKYNCYPKITSVIAAIIGMACAAVYFFTIYYMGEEYYNLLYFNVSKNNLVQCDRSSEEVYECTVYDSNNDVVAGVLNGTKDELCDELQTLAPTSDAYKNNCQ